MHTVPGRATICRMQERGSLKTIAEAAGVSISTVSRAFTRPELIGVETRARILAIADEIGYRPNRSARGLATGRTATVALMVPDIANPFFPPLVRAAENRAYERGFSVLLADNDEHEERESTHLVDLAAQVDGFVVCSPRAPTEAIRAAARRTPLVLVNRTIDGIASVSCATRGGMRQLVTHLDSLGHRKITYVAGPVAAWSDRERRDAVRRQARRHDMEVVVVGPYPATFEGGVMAADAVLASGGTAAVAFDDTLALGIIRRVAERGFRVPDDLSVTGCDDIVFAAMASPPLTTITTPVADAGRLAIDLLLDRLAGTTAPDEARQLVLDGTAVVRGSTAPAHRRRGGGKRSEA